MNKISFSDRYRLTKSVIKRWKTMTRRIVNEKIIQRARDYVSRNAKDDWDEEREKDEINKYILRHAPYKAGQIVAVAQSLKDMGYDPKEKNWKSGQIWGLDHTAAWKNKMFVSAFQCIHQIRITSVRVERLQDISEEDAVKEGVEYRGDLCGFITEADAVTYDTAREAFAALIDKISGKGTWDRNPLVYVYEFELVK